LLPATHRLSIWECRGLVESTLAASGGKTQQKTLWLDPQTDFGRKRVSLYRSQIREVINRNSLVSLALAHGYNAFLPVFDGGIDFILYNEETGDTKLVQLKGRWTIDKKYIGRNVWIAFHDRGLWYVAPHDELVKLAEGYGHLTSKSWDVGTYSKAPLSKQDQADLAQYRWEELQPVVDDAAEAAAEEIGAA
jgi:hypothetical protein